MSECKDMIRTYGGIELCENDSRILVVCIGKYCPYWPKEEDEADE